MVGTDINTITFGDGMTYQEKYNSGDLTGSQGKDGDKGIDGLQGVDGEPGYTYFECSSSSSAISKNIGTINITPIKGTKFVIKFINNNTVNNPELSYRTSSGNIIQRKPIMKDGSVLGGTWPAGTIFDLIYDGNSWIIKGQHEDNGLQFIDNNILSNGENITNNFQKAILNDGQLSGSYIGNGLIGIKGAITLNFPYKINMLFVTEKNNNNFSPGSLALGIGKTIFWTEKGGAVAAGEVDNLQMQGPKDITITSSNNGKTISYYSSNAAYMCNENLIEYTYVAF